VKATKGDLKAVLDKNLDTEVPTPVNTTMHKSNMPRVIIRHVTTKAVVSIF
jgi:hypothetical protein